MALVISTDFLYNCSIKMFLTKYSVNLPSYYQALDLISLHIKQSVFLNSFLADWCLHKLYDLVLSSSPAMANKRKKGGENNADNYVNKYVWFLICIYIK